MKKWMILGLTVLTGLSLVGCTTTEQHTVGGAATGAALGALAGGGLGKSSGARDKGALVGALVGGMVGHQVGRQQETTQQMEQRLQQVEQQAAQQTVWISNSNGSKTPVVLTRTAGGQWVGPRGEYYQNMPSAEQLKAIYGF